MNNYYVKEIFCEVQVMESFLRTPKCRKHVKLRELSLPNLI